MKSKLITIGIILVLLSIGALAFTYWNLNRTPAALSQDQNQATSTNGLSATDHQTNLDWLSNIQGVEKTTSTSASSTVTGDDLLATSTQAASSTTGLSATSTRNSATNSSITVQDLGNADAMDSTTYDLASNSLKLTATEHNSHVVLSWTSTKSATFASYLLLRSSSNPNPTPATVNPLRTIADKSAIEYEDMSSAPGQTYYYRICFMKTSGNPGCGNIIGVQLTP